MSASQRLIIAWLMATVLAGCGSHRPATTSIGTKPPASMDPCAAETALPKEIATPGSVVVFGEIHGVKELPWYFGESVCSTAKAGLPVAVGLEIPASEQAGIDSFLESAGRPADVEHLIAGTFWTSKDQDGRASQARALLLERIRRLRVAGLGVRVFPFDLSPGESADERDKTMASKISAQARAHPDELVMILVGDLHGWKTKGAPWDKNFVPMGWHLEDAGLRVISLGRSTPEGTAWVCDMTAQTCGPDKAPAYHPLPSGRTSGIELLPKPSSRGNDGLYAVATLTASPPAAGSQQTGR